MTGFVAALALSVPMGCTQVPGGTSRAEAAAAARDRGIALLGARDYKAARAELTKARPLQTGDVRALLAFAIAADMTSAFTMADQAYDALSTSTVDRATLFNNMGYSYMLRGDLDQAMSYLTEADRLRPGDPTIRNNIEMLRKVTVR